MRKFCPCRVAGRMPISRNRSSRNVFVWRDMGSAWVLAVSIGFNNGRLVILSAAKDVTGWLTRFFAALRMTQFHPTG